MRSTDPTLDLLADPRLPKLENSDSLKDRDFDLLVVSAPAEGATTRYLEAARQLVRFRDHLVLPRGKLGPTINDVQRVVESLSSKGEVRTIAGCGGARVMAATVVASAVASSDGAGGVSLAGWLQGIGGSANIASRLRADRPRPEVHLIPTTLLAVQSVPSKTWIINDPEELSTYWGSDDSWSLPQSGIHIQVDLLQRLFGQNSMMLLSNVGIVAAVLIETLAYPALDQAKELGTARQALKILIDLDRRRAWNRLDEGRVRRLLLSAMTSRLCENAVGPAMPALALTQAISRVTAKEGRAQPGALFGAGAAREMIRQLSTRSSRPPASHRPIVGNLPSGWEELCRSLHSKLRPTMSVARSLFPRIARAAAAQLLSQKGAQADESDHESVLARLL